MDERAGLSRFYDEGYTKWPREKFEALLLPDTSVDDPAVKQQLREWERSGFLRVVGDEQVFVVVLRAEP